MRGFLSILICLAMFCQPAYAKEIDSENPVPVIEAKAAVLIERTSGRVLFKQNENEILPIASTTKIMTALLALENAAPDDMVTAGENAEGVEGTSIYLSAGETLSMRDMLYGLMLRSGNDAAVAIAEHIDGDVETFAKRMNARAKELDASTRFVTPNGLDENGNGASALGMARIAAGAMALPAFREIVATQKKDIPWPGRDYGRELENKNKLLRTLDGATGIKTGYTSKAGRCLVFSCEREGVELIGVVLNCGTWFESATELIEWGFKQFCAETIAVKGEIAAQVEVLGGTDRSVDALFERTLTLPLAVGESHEIEPIMLPLLSAPVSKGQVIGHAVISINGETVTMVDLIAGAAIDERLSFIEAMKSMLCRWLGQTMKRDAMDGS